MGLLFFMRMILVLTLSKGSDTMEMATPVTHDDNSRRFKVYSWVFVRRINPSLVSL